jgi:hypothetical protein
MVTVGTLLLVGAQVALSQAPPPAQRHRPELPDKFTNLQVLPKDISKEQLVDTMRLFSRSLGVRCDHCHEVSMERQDWASDKKDAKNAARNMLKMVHVINADYMPKTEALPGEKSGDKVNCWTCHRGQKEPAQGPPPEEHREGPPGQQEHREEPPPGMGPQMGQQATPPGR